MGSKPTSQADITGYGDTFAPVLLSVKVDKAKTEESQNKALVYLELTFRDWIAR